jgi:hypothetical protein
MKKALTLTFFGLFLVISTAFAQAKRYALLEHFTNTLCSTCASQNPGMFATISVETNPDLHHISYHWQVPYANCIYYQENPTPQTERAAYYNIPGSPRVTLNGAAHAGTSYVTPPIIQTAATTSPISVKVSETLGTTGGARTVTIKIKSVGVIPTGNHKLYVAVVEKKTNYVSPNGEREHFNVFRKFLTNNSGNDITLTANEQSIFFNYVPDLGTSAQLYVVAWVQNTTSKEVLNSGTRFDGVTATNDLSVDTQITVSPNPTTAKTLIRFDKLTPQYLTVYNSMGSILMTEKMTNSTSYELNLSDFSTGVYIVKIKTAEGIGVKKIIKSL